MSTKFFRENYHVYLPLLLLPVIVFYKVTGHQFMTGWDDSWMVLNQRTIGGIHYYNLVAIFSETHLGQYSPVNQLTYSVIYSIFGAKSGVFHLASVLYHAINACLVYAFVKTLLGLRERENAKLVTATAFITALLFAVHPVNVEAVAWISASKASLYTLFGLSALLCYLYYLKSARKGSLLGSFVFFLLSFGCKEQAIALPLVLPLIDRFTGRNLRDKKVWLEKIPFFAFVLLGGLFTLSLRNHDYIAQFAGYPLWQRLVFACYAITEYLTKFIIPTNLMYIYPFPMVPGEPLPVQYFIYPFAIVVMAIVVIYYYRKQAILIFGMLFFLINVSSTLHFVSMSRITISADRWVYLSGVGFFMMASWYGVRFFMQQSKSKKMLICTVFGVYLLYLAGYAVKRSEVWHDSRTLKKEVRELLEKRKEYLELQELQEKLEEL